MYSGGPASFITWPPEGCLLVGRLDPKPKLSRKASSYGKTVNATTSLILMNIVLLFRDSAHSPFTVSFNIHNWITPLYIHPFLFFLFLKCFLTSHVCHAFLRCFCHCYLILQATASWLQRFWGWNLWKNSSLYFTIKTMWIIAVQNILNSPFTYVLV